MQNKLNIALIFGGRSGEHEISLLSAKSIYEALDKNKYNVHLVGIDKNGHWRIGKESELLLNSSDPELISLNENSPEVQTTAEGEKVALKLLDAKDPITTIDVIFPVMHGTFGEDGCIQGFLELMNTPYVGSGVLGSAIGMDKDVMKRLLRDSGIKIADYLSININDDLTEKVNEIIKKFSFPMFVKPANMGSSVGINKVKEQNDLVKSIEEAFEYDSKVIVEEYIKGREIEVAVLGNYDPKASIPGEIIPQHDFYSYEAKYLDENGASVKIPAELEDNKIKEIQEIAIKAFKALECSGMARIDFFLKENGDIYLNEINTIPGFTKVSMYPKLWEKSGVSYADLLDKLINLALEKRKEKDRLKRSFK